MIEAPGERTPGGSSRELRVLALIDHLVQGGAELLLSRFAAGAPDVGISFSVACLTEVWGNPAAEPLRAAGVEPVNLGVPQRLGPAALAGVRAHIARTTPDVVHTHLGSSDVLGGLAARSLGTPVVSTLHVPAWGGNRREQIKRALTVRVRRHCCARVIAVSEHVRADYLGRGWDAPGHVVTIHNGFDVATEPGAGAAVRAELGVPPDALVVGMVSALRPVKGHLIAVDAIARLQRDLPEVRLVIVGDGTEREAIQARAAPLGETVKLAGNRHDVMRMLDAFDVFLHPSFADPFPGSVIEAMAAAVPVVATDVGGIPEQVVPGETGTLVPAPPQADAVAGALREQLRDPVLRRRFGAAGRRRYEERMTSGPWLAQTRALYDVVLDERRAGRVGARGG